jgi:hypothetical protein
MDFPFVVLAPYGASCCAQAKHTTADAMNHGRIGFGNFAIALRSIARGSDNQTALWEHSFGLGSLPHPGN